ncbi:NADH-quinone oxidoreductase subunit NuoN [Ectothiorhodospiraceae bacterium 2226]|nr:NADH-quinone oxidoreductase subunit NuoN [Ectothiorhodospiraceae bacterium 2226]
MTFATAHLLPLAPEIFVLAMVCLILVVDLFLSDTNRGVTYLLSQATLVGAVAITLGVSTGETRFAFNDTFVADPMSDLLKIAIYVAVFVVFLYSREYLRMRQLFKGEFYVLGLFGMLGMMVLVSANNFLTIYLGLELLSLSLYAMVALRRDSVAASEAAMKYFVLGALASGMLLYGISMLYGVSGTLDLRELGTLIAEGDHNRVLLAFGLVFVIVGIAFKLGAVPFHMWIPDVYHGAPTAVTLYLSTAPKLAAFAMFMRVMVDGLEGLHGDWQGIIIILAVLSLAVGNVVAIAQSNIKRMLAYSTIAHVGFLLLGLLAGTPEGYAAAMFYTIAYVLMGLGAFGMIVFLSRSGFEAERLDDFKGLNERSPWYAFMMLILMFSLAGVPPFLGFWAKLAVLREVVAVELWWLAIVAVVFSIIGAFYYLRIVKLMYFDKPEDTAPIVASSDMRFMLSANSLAVLGFGLFPGALLAVCVAVLVP